MEHLKKRPTLVILAGGKSSRMKQPKGLLLWKNTYWILCQIETFIGTEVCIGLGYDYQLYFDAIPWLKEAVNTPITYHKKSIRVVINPNPALGPFSNLQSVLQHLKPDVQIVFLPVDVPLFNATAQKKLFTTNNLIAIPKHQDKNGHPIKINSEFRKIISKRNPTDKDARLDFLIKTRKASEISFIEVTDACCIENLNTPKDWQLFISN